MNGVVFVANGESNAEENWKRLLELAPDAQRIDNISGIYNAYHAAASLVKESHVLLVDADNWVTWTPDKSPITYIPPATPSVTIWRATNRVNYLCYGHGGLKLFPVKHLMSLRPTGADVTTSLKLPIHTEWALGSEHRFDTDEYNTWRTAFREAVKLSRTSHHGPDENARSIAYARLWAWRTQKTDRSSFCTASQAGATAGRDMYEDKLEELLGHINNEDWLRECYYKWSGKHVKV